MERKAHNYRYGFAFVFSRILFVRSLFTPTQPAKLPNPDKRPFPKLIIHGTNTNEIRDFSRAPFLAPGPERLGKREMARIRDAQKHKSQGGANRLFSTALDLQSHGQEKIREGWSGLGAQKHKSHGF